MARNTHALTIRDSIEVLKGDQLGRAQFSLLPDDGATPTLRQPQSGEGNNILDTPPKITIDEAITIAERRREELLRRKHLRIIAAEVKTLEREEREALMRVKRRAAVV